MMTIGEERIHLIEEEKPDYLKMYIGIVFWLFICMFSVIFAGILV